MSRKATKRHKTSIAKAWMRPKFSKIGEKMPDTLAINLPSYLYNHIISSYLTDDLSDLARKLSATLNFVAQ